MQYRIGLRMVCLAALSAWATPLWAQAPPRSAAGGTSGQEPTRPGAQAAPAGAQAAPAGAQPANNAAARPFPQPTPAAQQRLDQLLNYWEASSQDTKTLSCKFSRWRFETETAEGKFARTFATGEIRYAAPDKGLFRVDDTAHFEGMKDGKPQYGRGDPDLGDYWVCNGKEILDFDKKTKTCRIQELPPEMQGKKIFEGPLPFVFNLEAEKIKQRYWIQELQPPPGSEVYLLEAYPKYQSDRANYHHVKIYINAKDFLPHSLVIYAPNWQEGTTEDRDHYQFSEMSKNAVLSNMSDFMNVFIKARPPADWTIVRERFGAVRQAAMPDGRKPNR
jgi:TIGR03009 family protein